MSFKKPIIFLLLLSFHFAQAQQTSIAKIEPPNWWSGMKLNNIQLMIYGTGLDNVSIRFEPKGIEVKSIEKTENSSYSFLNISVPDNITPQTYKIIVEKNGMTFEKEFPIYPREKGSRHQGFSSSDVIYLIMPDRFANGDTSNDNVKGLIDSLSEGKKDARHGGDIQGLINNLDYFNKLGVTALWLTPLVENNTEMSYHGYGATDFYNIDPRLGSNKLYKKLVDEAHKKNIKIILDHVANHFNKTHPWMDNLPYPEWIHGTLKEHTPADHNKMVFMDPYRDTISIKKVSEGWFTNYLVDINQSNEQVKNYIIQNTIWWIEYSGLDGIREDTYPYSDQKFLAEWAKVILEEYPQINILGEVWTGEPAYLSTFQKGNLVRGYDSYLPSVTDFGMRDKFYEFLTGRGTLFNFYETLTKDYLYPEPDNLVTFFDNHDMARGLYYAKGNIDKMKIVYLLLMTTRGIPQLLYGSETTLVGDESHDKLRFNFPGGFIGDSVDYFHSKNLSALQMEYFNYIQKLLSLRKNHKALTEGKIIHYPPKNGIYTYFKTSEDEKFMIIVNEKTDDTMIDLTDHKNILNNKKLYDVLNDTFIADNYKVLVRAVSGSIFKIE